MLFFAMVLQRFCSWGWGEWSGWMAWEKSVVAGCAVFCNGFATFFDGWVKKSDMCKKSGGARRAAFCKGFVRFMAGQESGKCTLCCFLQWFLYT